jgi:hypothetical protein
MDPDISIWRKTGHFYFALTRVRHVCDRKRILLFAGLLRSPPKQAAHFIHLKVSGITNSIRVDSGSDEAKKYVPMQNMYNVEDRRVQRVRFPELLPAFLPNM